MDAYKHDVELHASMNLIGRRPRTERPGHILEWHRLLEILSVSLSLCLSVPLSLSLRLCLYLDGPRTNLCFGSNSLGTNFVSDKNV